MAIGQAIPPPRGPSLAACRKPAVFSATRTRRAGRGASGPGARSPCMDVGQERGRGRGPLGGVAEGGHVGQVDVLHARLAEGAQALDDVVGRAPHEVAPQQRVAARRRPRRSACSRREAGGDVVQQPPPLARSAARPRRARTPRPAPSAPPGAAAGRRAWPRPRRGPRPRRSTRTGPR